jgi:hypothetical protein
MLIDCDGCVVRGAACGDCVVSVLLGAPPGGVELDGAERRALAVLADAGMVPQLRLITEGEGVDRPDPVEVPLPGTGDPPAVPPQRNPPARRRVRHVA